MADDKKSDQAPPKSDDKKADQPVLDGKDKKPSDDGKKADDGKAADDKQADDTKDGKSGSEGKDEGNKDDKAGAESKVPEKYELKRPDDELFTDEDMAEYATAAKAMGLTQKQADALVQRDVDRSNALRTAFLTELKADKDLGGEKFDATVDVANKGLRAFLKDSPQEEQDQVIGMLARSGYSNHKALVRAFARLGKLLKEDQPDGGGKGGGKTDKTDAEVFYGRK